MELSWLDIGFFLAFICFVVGFSLYKSRKKKETSEDYFLAGRSLGWYLIGFSLIASNISTEQFVGMSGQKRWTCGDGSDCSHHCSLHNILVNQRDRKNVYFF